MTKVGSAGGIGPSAGARAATARPKKLGPGFAVVESESPQPVAVAPPATNGGLLLLQDETAPFNRDREAGRGGKRALAALKAMQISLLAGDPRQGLEALEAALHDLPEAADAGLCAIVAAIRQRAHVEAARFEAARRSPRLPRREGDDPSVTS